MDSPPTVPAQTCLNCGHEVSLQFCPSCGQKLSVRKRTLWFVISDFIAHSFAYDGRFWRTVLPLVGKPGWLTEQNLQGRWVSFLPPLRVFLVVSLLFFFTFSWHFSDLQGHMFTINGDVPDRVADPAEITPFTTDYAIGNYLNGLIQDRVERLNALAPEERERALYRELLASIPTAVFLALPLMALGLKGLYLFRKRLFFEHFVFATHFYSVWLLVMIPSIIVQDEWLWFAGHLVYLPLYCLFAVKRVYRQGWIATIAKTTMLGFWQIMSFVLLSLVVLLSAFLHV